MTAVETRPRSAAAEEGVIRLLCLDPSLFAGREGLGRGEIVSTGFRESRRKDG